MAIDAYAHLGEIMEIVGRAGDELFASLCDRLAGILGLGARQRCDVLGNQITEFAQPRGPLGSGPPRPGGDGCLGGRDGRIDLGGAAACDLRQHFLSRGIDGLEVTSARDRLAIDEMVDLHVRVTLNDRRAHPLRWCSAAGRGRRPRR